MKSIAMLLMFFLLGTAFGSVNDEKSFITADLNDYIDTILPSMRDFIGAQMDPMDIPDILEGFSVKPLWITYHGELELTKGKLTGLTSLARTGDFTVAYLNKLLRIRGDFGFKNIGFTYRYLAKIMNIGPTGGVKGKVTRVSGVVDILIDFNNNELHLQDFYLHSVGTVTVKLTGNILVDWLSNAIIKVITTLFKGIIINSVEDNLREALQEKIDEINNSMSAFSRFLEEVNQQAKMNIQHLDAPLNMQLMDAPINKLFTNAHQINH